MPRQISEAVYREEAAMVAMLDAMNEPLDPRSAALLAQFREDVTVYEVEHHLPLSVAQSAPLTH